MDKVVSQEFLIKFKDYRSKLKMMDTALYLFGMKLYKQEGSIEFFDADFMNAIQIKS